MSSNVSNAKREGKEESRTPREEWGGVQLKATPLAKISRELRSRGASGSAAKAPTREIPPAAQAKTYFERR